LVLGHRSAGFVFPDRPAVSLNLGVLARSGVLARRITFYDASRLEQ
jgi:hypothetical protein